MLLSKTQLLAAQFASEDESQRGLGVLRVEPAGVVWATNGRYIVKVSAIGSLPEENFPVVLAGSLPVSDPILIPRALALAVARAIPKRSNLPVLGYAQLRALPAGRAVLAVTDLIKTPQLWYIEPQDVTFPNVEAVMPFTAQPLVAPIGLSAKYLSKLAGYAQKTAWKGRFVAIRWEFSSPVHAARFSWKTKEGEEIDGRLMPMRL